MTTQMPGGYVWFAQCNFSDEEHASPFMQGQYSPYEWESNMLPLSIGGRDADWYVEDMERDKNGVWTCNLPLPNGWFGYCYDVDGIEGAQLKDFTDATFAARRRIPDGPDQPGCCQRDPEQCHRCR